MKSVLYVISLFGWRCASFVCQKKKSKSTVEFKKSTSVRQNSFVRTESGQKIECAQHASWERVKPFENSGATDNIARDHRAFVEYRRISQGTKCIYVGNNFRVEAKGIGTCKLELRGGRILYLHDVLYALEIQRYLVSIIFLLRMRYQLQFYSVRLKIVLNSTLVATGYLLDGFMVLYTNYYDLNNSFFR